MVTGYPSVDSALLAMKYGALNFMVKPLKFCRPHDRLLHRMAWRQHLGGVSEQLLVAGDCFP
jgi:DNA-binding NtrC family response regulator